MSSSMEHSRTCRSRACPIVPIILTCLTVIASIVGLAARAALDEMCSKIAYGARTLPCTLLFNHIIHLYIAFLFFAGGAIVFYVLVEKLRFRAMWAAGLMAGVVIVLGRLVRDIEKFAKEDKMWQVEDWLPPKLAITFYILVPILVQRKRPSEENIILLPYNRMTWHSGMSLDVAVAPYTKSPRCEVAPTQNVKRVFAALFAACVLVAPLYVAHRVSYAVWETAIFLIVFTVAGFAQEPLEQIGTAGHWLAAWWSGAMFYTGREIRDFHQLGFWETAGFNFPLYGVTALFAAAQLLHVASLWLHRDVAPTKMPWTQE